MKTGWHVGIYAPVFLAHIQKTACCYVLACLCSCKFTCWDPNPEMKVLKDRAFARWLGPEGRALTNGIRAPSAMQGYSEKTDVNEDVSAPVLWSWILQPPEMWKLNGCHLQPVQFMVFCCSSLNALRFSLKPNNANLCGVETYALLGGGRWGHVGGVWVQ